MYQVRNFDPKTIRWWYNHRKEIDMSPAYQRQGRLWSKSYKQLLIDSILNEYDIPKLYIADFTLRTSPSMNPSGKNFAVVDGKQRLEAIFDFIDGNLALASEFVWVRDRSLSLGDLTYLDLVKNHSMVSELFDDYILSVVAIITDDSAMINDQFIRLNSSKPLSGAEIRNAIVGVVTDTVRSLIRDQFFETRIRFKTARGEDKNLATKFLLMEFTGQPTETSKSNLDTFTRRVMDAGSQEIAPAESAVVTALTTMNEIFIKSDPLLAKAGHISSYYWFIRNQGDLFTPQIRPFLVYFEKTRAAVRKEMKTLGVEGQTLSNVNPEDSLYIVYNTILRSVDDASSIRSRSLILSRLFQKWLIEQNIHPYLSQ